MVVFLRESQWWDEEKYYCYQLEKLKELLIEAIKFTQYYAEKFNSMGLSVTDIVNAKTIEELLHPIPFLEKETLRCFTDKFISKNPKRKTWDIVSTSGTTGSPLRVYFDKEGLQLSFAFWRRFHDWLGLPESFRQVRFSGRQLFAPEKKHPPFWLYNPFNRQLFMSTYHISQETLKYYVKKIEEFRPALLDGYPSALYILGKYIIDHDIRLSFKPTAVATTAETLYDFQKETIQQAFQCKVYNQYASSEGAPWISECEYGSLHINPESGIFEFLSSDGKPAGPGDIAEVIVTSFCNYKVPLIRYRIGDYVELPEKPIQCQCGRKMPIVKNILGREDDIIVTPDGRLIGIMSHHILRDARNIKKAQIIQHSQRHFEIKIVKSEGYSKMDEKFIKENFYACVGKNIEIVFNYVDEIPLGSSGKFRSVIRLFPLKSSKIDRL